MMKNSTFTDEFSLLSDFGQASSFIEATTDNSKLTIQPVALNVGEYKIKMTLTDGVESFTKEMLLNVKASISTAE